VIGLVAALLLSQPYPASGIRVQDEGVTRGSNVSTINCTGTGLTCSVSGTRATFDASGGGGGAPTTATYITQTADAGLSAEQALSGLTTGLLKVTTGTGVLSTAAAGSDYQAAGSYSGVGACGTNLWASTLSAGTGPTCTQPAFSNLSGSASSSQIPPASAALGGVSMAAACGAGNHVSSIVAGELTCSADSGGGGTPGGLNTQIQYNDTGTFAGSANLAWDNTNQLLNIGQATPYTNNPLAVAGTIDGWLQVNVQNRSAGTAASTDLVATADSGNDSINYIDMGINSSAYSQAAYSIGGALDGYLMTNGGHLAIGTQTATKTVKVHTGGTTSSELRATVSDGSLNLASGVGLQFNGAPGTTSQVLHGAASGSQAWGAVELGTEVSGTLPAGRGGTGLATFAADTVPLAAAANSWTATAVPSCSGATSVLTYSTGTHTFGCGTISAGGVVDGGTWRQKATRVAHCQPITVAGTTWGCNGITVPTVTGTPATVTVGTRAHIQVPTTNVSGNASGHISVFTASRADYRPIYAARMRTDTAITLRRHYHGLQSASTAALAVTTGTASSTIRYVALAFDTAVNANWLCCSGDGTTHGCTSTGVAVAVSTEYALTVDHGTAGTLSCTVNGTTVTKSTNLPTGTNNIGIVNGITTNSAAIVNLQMSWFDLEQN